MNPYLEQFINKTFDKPSKVLDLGSGNYQDVLELSQKGWLSFGVDKKDGINLNQLYSSPYKPFNLVYSLFVWQFLDDPDTLMETVEDNLKNNGWVYLLTFDESDQSTPNWKSPFNIQNVYDIMTKHGFLDVNIKVFPLWDDALGHKHWHQVLEVSGQLKKAG